MKVDVGKKSRESEFQQKSKRSEEGKEIAAAVAAGEGDLGMEKLKVDEDELGKEKVVVASVEVEKREREDKQKVVVVERKRWGKRTSVAEAVIDKGQETELMKSRELETVAKGEEEVTVKHSIDELLQGNGEDRKVTS